MRFEKPSRHFNLLLMGLLAFNFLPHITEHVFVLLVFGLGSIGWRLAYEYQKIRLPNKIIKVVLVALGALGVYFIYGDLRSVEATTAILLAGAALKMLDNVEYRDAMVLLMVCFFVLMAGFLQSQTMAMTLFGGLDLILVTSLMFQLHKGKSLQLNIWYMLKLGAKLSLMIAPLMVLLFVVFPRVATGILNNSTPQATSGFSDDLDAGGIDQLALSDATAFRVSFTGDVPRPNELYWRGQSFSKTYGLKWRKGHKYRSIFPTNTNPDLGENPYRVAVEAKYGKWLFFLDYPSQLKLAHPRYYRNLETNDRGEYRLKKPLGQRLQYEGARTTEGIGFSKDIGLEEYLQLPERIPTGVEKYLKSLKFNGDSTQDIADAVLGDFQRNFKYSLNLGEKSSKEIDEFLLDNKVGFCEHFAASFAYLMRMKGIPSRVIVGFQGGKKNRLGDYYIVSERDAHAWTEVYFKETGSWKRIDPTQSVAPMRIQLGGQVFHQLTEEQKNKIRSAEDYYSSLKGLSAEFERVKLIFDMIEERWNYFLLNYDFEAQKKLFESLGFKLQSRRSLWLVSMVILLLFFIGFRYRQLRKLRMQKHPADILWEKAYKTLEKQGKLRPHNMGLRTYFLKLVNEFPNDKDLFTKLSAVYMDLKYAKNSRYDLVEFENLLKKLKKSSD